MALDRGPLARTRGLRFAKLVGTGDARTFTPRDADPTRWGLVTAWDDAEDLRRFQTGSPVVRAWNRIAVEAWHAQLLPLRSRGTWSGIDPFPHVRASPADGPVAALTRARLQWRRARSFWRAAPPVSAALQDAGGLRYAIGFGEAPVGVQGTLSMWDSAQSLAAFAYDGDRHRAAIRATTELGWYREELFARFAVTASSGTIDGRDPLQDGAVGGVAHA